MKSIIYIYIYYPGLLAMRRIGNAMNFMTIKTSRFRHSTASGRRASSGRHGIRATLRHGLWAALDLEKNCGRSMAGSIGWTRFWIATSIEEPCTLLPCVRFRNGHWLIESGWNVSGLVDELRRIDHGSSIHRCYYFFCFDTKQRCRIVTGDTKQRCRIVNS